MKSVEAVLVPSLPVNEECRGKSKHGSQKQSHIIYFCVCVCVCVCVCSWKYAWKNGRSIEIEDPRKSQIHKTLNLEDLKEFSLKV